MIIPQYSRIAHHTTSGTTASVFTGGPSNDFTDGTWNATHLVESEIGVNETAQQAYIQIGANTNLPKRFELNDWGTASTVGDTYSVAVQMLPPNLNTAYYCNVDVSAIDDTSNGYMFKLFGGFKNDGTVKLVGNTYSVLAAIKDNSANPYAKMEVISGIPSVSVYGITGATISWTVNARPSAII